MAKLPRFESEFDASQVPQPSGDPIENTPLDDLVKAMPPGARVEGSMQNLLLDAVQTYYLAKRFHELVGAFDGFTNRVVAGALSTIGANMMRLAVITVASVNDSSARSRSLPATITALETALKASGGNVTAETAGLKNIKKDIDANKQVPFKYVRHLRNKWAGHASLDREFDNWANTDTTLSLPLLEEALVRLVNAYEDLVELIDGSPTLQQLTAKSASSTPADGPIPFSVDWTAVTPLALVLRDTARRSAEALVDQLQSPPGYGSPEDTDWRVDSSHAHVRAAIDKAASSVTVAGQ